MTIQTILFPVRDVNRAKAFYTELLGAEPAHDQPYYVAYEVGGLHIGLVPNGHATGMTGPVVHQHVDDMTKTIEQLVAAGGTVKQEPKNVAGNRFVATVEDAEGNTVGLIEDRES